ncbi:hypothetical protein PISMIDRAFT_112689, partial [Pisolithus microcarpus 441]
VEEQMGIFLYMCMTGLSSHLVGECFQHSMDTITKYFKCLITFFSSPLFYESQVQFPMSNTPISQKITRDPHFRFFDQCIGAVNSSHICVFPSSNNHAFLCNRKGFLSQNCLLACDFNFKFHLHAVQVGHVSH